MRKYYPKERVHPCLLKSNYQYSRPCYARDSRTAGADARPPHPSPARQMEHARPHAVSSSAYAAYGSASLNDEERTVAAPRAVSLTTGEDVNVGSTRSDTGQESA